MDQVCSRIHLIDNLTIYKEKLNSNLSIKILIKTFMDILKLFTLFHTIVRGESYHSA